MSFEEKRSIQEAFDEYNTKRLSLITDTTHTYEEKIKIGKRLYDEYLSEYRKIRKQKAEEIRKKKEEIEKRKKEEVLRANGIPKRFY